VTPAIELRGVSKTFVLRRNPVRDLKILMLGWFHPELREHREVFWALREVDLGVRPGEFLGVIGPNGSGKSTLLRIIAGIYSPSSGHVAVNGRVAPMIDLGVGFHPDLSGRENVYLSTSLYGLSGRETDAIYDAIVEFAELGDFMDVPVKNYSTGMHARLGFAVAAHLDPDILLVDEVLAVGDQSFQDKCIRRLEEMRRRGKTIVVVSHSLASVHKMCDWACLLVGGRLLETGDPERVVARYREIITASIPMKGEVG